MFKKVMISLTLLFVLLLAVSSVNAFNNDTTDVVCEENIDELVGKNEIHNDEIITVANDDVIDASEIEDKLSTERSVSKKTFSAIQTTIDAASTNDVIKLSGTYYGSGQKITISKKISLVGDGETILDAKGLSKILEISAKYVTIENIKFINGYDKYVGGGICCSGASDYVTVRNCVFSNNVGLNGNHIYWAGNYGTIDGCKFNGKNIYGMTFRTSIYNSVFTDSSIDGQFNDHYISGCTFIDYPSYYSWSNSVNCNFYDSTNIQASKVTATYKASNKLVVTLKDGKGNLINNKYLTIKVGSISKKILTNSKGQVSVVVSGLVPKAYTAAIQFAGDSEYVASSKKVSVVVKKATPKLTAKAKTFKKSVKTTKYTVTLKDNVGKAMKKVKLTLKIKGKTYKANSNNKGKTTFKIKKLAKKGTYKATVTYKGNAYYNKVTKKVNIKIK